jgi:hypothetical protein
MVVFSLAFWLGVGAGGSLIWFCKDALTRAFTGTENFIKALEAKAAALKAAL